MTEDEEQVKCKYLAYGYNGWLSPAGEAMNRKWASAAYSYVYAYDSAGNRTSMTNTSNYGGGPTTTNYGYDAANKLTTAGAKSYAYDGAGNTISATFNGATTTYSWDWRNELIGLSGAQTASFAYDGLGNRVSETTGGNTTQFMLDGREVAEAIVGGNVTSYVGPGVVCEIQNGNRTVFHSDGIGSTRVTTDYSGRSLGTNTYDAYGNWVAWTSSTPPFAYAGQYRYYADGNTGLDYLKPRYYEPQVGRFASRDPIRYRGGLNLYAYVIADPTNRVDPSGMIDSSDPTDPYGPGYATGPGLWPAWDWLNDMASFLEYRERTRRSSLGATRQAGTCRLRTRYDNLDYYGQCQVCNDFPTPAAITACWAACMAYANAVNSWDTLEKCWCEHMR